MSHSVSRGSVVGRVVPGIAVWPPGGARAAALTVLVLAALQCILASRAAYADSPGLLVGVISPTSSQRSIGKAHEETVKFAAGRQGRTLKVGKFAVPMNFEYRDDESDPAKAVARARELVQLGAVAILGPVDSSSTQAVLDAHLEVPVLSALSTAPSLLKPRDPWFFRLTLGDDERMQRYAETLRKVETRTPAPVVVLYNRGDPYGEGLRAELMKPLGLTDALAVAWSDLVDGGSISDGNRELVRSGRAFTAAIDEVLEAHPKTVFTLGTASGAVAIARGIEAYVRGKGGTPPQRFIFVGADSELLAGAPDGSITVGDPTVVEADGTEVASIRSAFREQRHLPPEDFVVTAFDAAFYVLPQALRETIASLPEDDSYSKGPDGLPPAEALRTLLRGQLEKLTFESIEPWRRIRLQDGQMTGTPAVPVYEISRHYALLDTLVPEPWLEVDGPSEVGMLEGPVTMHIRPHGLSAGAVAADVLRTDVRPNRTVTAATRVLQDGRVEVSFYPKWPGEYRLQPKVNVPTLPPQPAAVVKLRYGYALAFAGALLGSLFFILAVTDRGARVSRRRVVLGVLTGVLLAAAGFNRTLLPAGIPLPTVGDSSEFNPLWTGFAGGWFGPGALMFVLGRFMPGGQTSSTNGAPAPSPPPPEVPGPYA